MHFRMLPSVVHPLEFLVRCTRCQGTLPWKIHRNSFVLFLSSRTDPLPCMLPCRSWHSRLVAHVSTSKITQFSVYKYKSQRKWYKLDSPSKFHPSMPVKSGLAVFISLFRLVLSASQGCHSHNPVNTPQKFSQIKFDYVIVGWYSSLLKVETIHQVLPIGGGTAGLAVASRFNYFHTCAEENSYVTIKDWRKIPSCKSASLRQATSTRMTLWSIYRVCPFICQWHEHIFNPTTREHGNPIWKSRVWLELRDSSSGRRW